MPGASQKIKTVLLVLIALAFSAVAVLFIGFRMLSNRPDVILDTLKDQASLSIQNLHQTATRDGKPEWTLDAKSASLTQAGNRSDLEDLSVVFFLENNTQARLTADKGVLENDTSNFTVTGNVVLKNPDYVLTTDELHYNHQKQILYSTVHTDIKGKTMHFSADRTTFIIPSHQARLEGGVKGVISGKIQF